MGWLDRVFGKTPSNAGSPVQSSAAVGHSMTDQYAINERDALGSISCSQDVIPDLIKEGNFAWAAYNYEMVATSQTELGLLHWRRGLDPRPDFERAIDAYDNLCVMARTKQLKGSDYSLPLVYAMLSLMGRKVAIEFHNAKSHQEYSDSYYKCCLVHALHDQPLDERHAGLLEKHLTENNELPDRSFLAYFQLLGLRPSDQSPGELVQLADANWAKRKRDRIFADGPSLEGYGIMNELYVDIYLAAVLQKIGWEGESVHRWKWETPLG